MIGAGAGEPAGAKAGLRALCRGLVDAMSLEARAAASARVRERVLGSGWWRDASGVLLFGGDAGEPDLDGLIRAGNEAGKSVCVASIDWGARALRPRLVRSAEELVVGRHGVRVPGAGCPVVETGAIGLVLVPGVGFDPSGGRLGRGGGFYDRFLGSWRGGGPMGEGGEGRAAVGVGFGCQVVERVPMEGHDRRLDGLVTEGGVWAFG